MWQKWIPRTKNNTKIRVTVVLQEKHAVPVMIKVMGVDIKKQMLWSYTLEIALKLSRFLDIVLIIRWPK